MVKEKGSPAGGKTRKITVLMKLLGPLGGTKIRSIKKTVWFWGILLGERMELGLDLN
jgi:hypothetical protein